MALYRSTQIYLLPGFSCVRMDRLVFMHRPRLEDSYAMTTGWQLPRPDVFHA